MDYLDYDEFEEYEPTEIEGMDDAVKLESTVIVDVKNLQSLISGYVNQHLHAVMQGMIQREVIKCIQSSYGSKARFADAIENVLRKKLEEKYPDVVENKLNELVSEIKNHKFKFDRYSGEKTLKTKALAIVNDYIEKELAGEVKKSTEYIEQFSKNYFANNLFRAMGMMDKLIPIADPEASTQA